MTSGSRNDWTDVRRISGDAGKLALLGVGTTAGIAATALVLLPALRNARAHLRAVFDWKHPAVRKMLRLSGWTIGYVVTNQIALLFVLVLAKSGTTGDVSAYLYALRLLPSAARPPRGLDHDDDDAGALAAARRSDDFPELARKFRLGLRYHRAAHAPRVGAVRRARAADGGGARARRVRARTTPPSPPTRCRRSRSGSSRFRCTSTRCAASTRCATRARRSSSTPSRTC